MAKAVTKTKVPAGYSAVMPYLRVKGAAEAIEFYKAAFGAKERFRLTMGDRLGHAEIEIGNAVIMLSDEFPEKNILGPKSLKGTTFALSIYVEDVDAMFDQAVAAGGSAKRPPTDEFYGDRTGQIEDPFGHLWMIQARIEEVSPSEMQKRLDALMAGSLSEPPPAEAETPKQQAPVASKPAAKKPAAKRSAIKSGKKKG